jgi:hypothetical protein
MNGVKTQMTMTIYKTRREEAVESLDETRFISPTDFSGIICSDLFLLVSILSMSITYLKYDYGSKY